MKAVARLQAFWPWIGVSVCGLGAVVILTNLAYSRDKYFDWLRYKQSEARALDGPDSPIVIVGYDSASARRYGTLPPRGIEARVLERIGRAGAKAIGLDLLHADPDVASQKVAAALGSLAEFGASNARLRSRIAAVQASYDDEGALARAIRQYDVIEAFANSNESGEGDPWDRLPETDRVDAGEALHPGACAQAGERGKAIFDEGLLFDAARAHANALIVPDQDGTVRRYPLFAHIGDSPFLFPSLAAATASRYLDDAGVYADCDGRGNVTHANVGAMPDLAPVMEPDGTILIDYGGNFLESFPNVVSFAQVLETDERGGWAVPDSRFAGKAVFVGSRTDEVDTFTTPWEVNFSGVGFHATVAWSLITGKFLHYNPSYLVYEAIATMLIGILGIVTIFFFPGARVSGTLGVLYFLLPFGAHRAGVVWLRHGYLVDAFWPAFFGSIGFFAALATRYFAEQERAEETKRELGSFLSPDVVDLVLQDRALVAPAKREISILFSDIRNFTTTAEGMSPEALVALLHDYLTRMTAIVEDQRGTLDKYIGDAVMALFGAPKPNEAHPVYACRAALEMMRVMETLRAEWKAKGQPVLDIGIGVNTGVVSVGRMGSASKAEYTCIGDEVNFASRLEGLNKFYRTHVIVGERTRVVADEAFVFRDLGLVTVKGKTKAQRIYELVGAHDGTTTLPAWIAMWDQALAAFLRRDWDTAERGFRDVDATREGGDPSSHVFLEFVREFRLQPPPDGWEGTIERHEK